MRKPITEQEVKKFKQSWYEATSTGKSVAMTFSGDRSETITHTTQPHEVGIKNPEHIKDIVAFRNSVFEYNLVFNTSYKYVSLQDEMNINVLAQFIDNGVIESIEPFGAGNIVVIQTRIDEATKRPITAPVMMCRIKFNPILLSYWLEEKKLEIEKQIAKEEEIVH